MYDAQHSSPTTIACEQAELFGATPGPDEPDSRDLWDEDDAMHAVDSAFHAFAGDIARDGTQLADERESFLWGFVNLFHAQVNRLGRAVDALKPKLRDLERAQDGTEINAWELERTVDRARALGDRRDAFEKMRDHAAGAYRTETGSTWRPRRGSHVSQTAKLTSAAIDARDFLRAREHRANEAHLPDGTLVAVAGGKEAGNVNAVCTALDRVRGACHVIVGRSWPASQPNTVSRIGGAARGAQPSESSPIRADIMWNSAKPGPLPSAD